MAFISFIFGIAHLLLRAWVISCGLAWFGVSLGITTVIPYVAIIAALYMYTIATNQVGWNFFPLAASLKTLGMLDKDADVLYKNGMTLFGQAVGVISTLSAWGILFILSLFV